MIRAIMGYRADNRRDQDSGPPLWLTVSLGATAAIATTFAMIWFQFPY